MNLYANTAIDPDQTRPPDIWPSTLAELKRRGLKVHGSLSGKNVESGATAVVLKATEEASGRVVAIKVYKNPKQHVQHRNGSSIPMTNFFENERRMLVGLQACPVIPVYFYSVDNETRLTGAEIQPFHVMEFVEGKSIFEHAKSESQGSQKVEENLKHFRRVLDAVKSIHQFGFLHRDISDRNILVDKSGRVRLIDLAEASPLGEEHSRLISVPAAGTPGIVGPEEPVTREFRKIQTDDINAACTIGYALFVGQMKGAGEKDRDWRRRLLRAGAPEAVANILSKGMRTRNPNHHPDPRVWNSAQEIEVALDTVARRRRRRRMVWRSTGILLALILVIGLVAIISGERLRQQTYVFHVQQLNGQRLVLEENPQKIDPRVRQRVAQANELESQAAVAHQEGDLLRAVSLLQKASEQIDRAITEADDIRRLAPLFDPLRVLLNENKQWNTNCPAILDQLTRLQQAFLKLKQNVEQSNPRKVWQAVADLQADLVGLIRDNQASLEVAELFSEFDQLRLGLSDSLSQQPAFQRMVTQRQRAENDYYSVGKWSEAKAAMLVHQQGLQSFLAEHESSEQRKIRMADQVQSWQMLESLQSQVAALHAQVDQQRMEISRLEEKNDQLRLAIVQQTQNSDELVRHRDQLQLELSSRREELIVAQEKVAELEEKAAAVAAQEQENSAENRRDSTESEQASIPQAALPEPPANPDTSAPAMKTEAPTFEARQAAFLDALESADPRAVLRKTSAILAHTEGRTLDNAQRLWDYTRSVLAQDSEVADRQQWKSEYSQLLQFALDLHSDIRPVMVTELLSMVTQAQVDEHRWNLIVTRIHDLGLGDGPQLADATFGRSADSKSDSPIDTNSLLRIQRQAKWLLQKYGTNPELATSLQVAESQYRAGLQQLIVKEQPNRTELLEWHQRVAEPPFVLEDVRATIATAILEQTPLEDSRQLDQDVRRLLSLNNDFTHCSAAVLRRVLRWSIEQEQWQQAQQALERLKVLGDLLADEKKLKEELEDVLFATNLVERWSGRRVPFLCYTKVERKTHVLNASIQFSSSRDNQLSGQVSLQPGVDMGSVEARITRSGLELSVSASRVFNESGKLLLQRGSELADLDKSLVDFGYLGKQGRVFYAKTNSMVEFYFVDLPDHIHLLRDHWQNYDDSHRNQQLIWYDEPWRNLNSQIHFHSVWNSSNHPSNDRVQRIDVSQLTQAGDVTIQGTLQMLMNGPYNDHPRSGEVLFFLDNEDQAHYRKSISISATYRHIEQGHANTGQSDISFTIPAGTRMLSFYSAPEHWHGGNNWYKNVTISGMCAVTK